VDFRLLLVGGRQAGKQKRGGIMETKSMAIFFLVGPTLVICRNCPQKERNRPSKVKVRPEFTSTFEAVRYVTFLQTQKYQHKSR
jgi:hypothetical protein